MSEMLDEKSLMNERRGQTLKVLAILSWVSIGMSVVGILFALASGPMSVVELEEVKATLMEQWTPLMEQWSQEEIDTIAKPIIDEMFMRLEVQNDLYYALMGIQLAYLVLGAYGVLLMYQLRKMGYYYYLVYSIVPLVVEIGFFGSGLITMMIVIWSLVISIVFWILYGFQLKRMS